MNKTCKIICAIAIIAFLIVFGILLYKQFNGDGFINEKVVIIDDTPCPRVETEKEETTPTDEENDSTKNIDIEIISDKDWDIQKITTKLLSTKIVELKDNKNWLCHDFLTDYYQYEEIEQEQFLSPIVQPSIEPVSQESTFHQIGETEKTNETITIVTEKNNEPYFNVSSYNRTALIHLLFFEDCGGKTEEDIKEQRAIISVVFNRLLSGSYEHCYDVSDIIFYQYSSGSYAFSPASDKDRFWNFKDENEKKDFERNYNQLAEKVDYVIEHGCTVPSNVLYFVSNKCYEESSYFKNNHKVYCVYDGTTFMTTEKP